MKILSKEEIKAKIEADFGGKIEHFEGESIGPETGYAKYSFTTGAVNQPVQGEVIVSPTGEYSKYRLQNTLSDKKHKIILMNSAMMPVPGTYNCAYITKAGFAALYSLYQKSGFNFENRIGYTETINHLHELTGDTYIPNREETRLEDGDVMMVIKLPYRPKDPDHKSQLKPEEYSYSIIKYFRN